MEEERIDDEDDEGFEVERVSHLEHLPAFTERWAPEALTPRVLSQVGTRRSLGCEALRCGAVVCPPTRYTCIHLSGKGKVYQVYYTIPTVLLAVGVTH